MVASFLELEAAARSSFHVENQHISESSSSVNDKISPIQVNSNSIPYVVAKSASVMLDYGSNVACETSDIGSPRFGRDYHSEVGTEGLSLDEDSMSPGEKLLKYGMYNIDESLFMGQVILEQLEGFPNVLDREIVDVTACNRKYDNSSKNSNLVGITMERLSESGNSKVIHHSRKLTVENAGSDLGSQRGSGLSNSAFLDTFDNGLLDHSSVGELTQTVEILGNSELSPSDGHLIIPLDQRHKLNRVLMTMQRRLVTAKTDMEDLISRLNQEIAVKDYLKTKVKGLEVELEAVKQRNKENLEQANLVERERFTEMQWDMEELRRRSIEIELKLKAQQEGNLDLELRDDPINQEKDMLQQELDSKRLHLEDLQKQHRELEAKSKADIKVLVKEVKSLRNCQADLKEQLNQSLEEKAEVERHFQLEKYSGKQLNTATRKLLHNTEILRTRLLECNTNLFTENN